VTEKQQRKISQNAAESRPSWPIPPASIAWILVIALIAGLIYVSRDFVLILFLSATLAYLLNPIVKIVESALIKRRIAVAVVYLVIGAVFLGAGYFFYPRLAAEIETLTNNLPSFGERLNEAIDAVQSEIVSEHPAAATFFATREVRYQTLNSFLEQQAKDLPLLVGQLASIILASVLIPFFAYFFLRDSRHTVQFFFERVPTHYIETSVAIWREIDRIVGRYLRGVALEGLALGTLAAIGLWLLGINYPLLLGAFSGVASLVPYLGPILGGGSAVLVALVQFKSLAPIAKVVALYLGLKLLDILAIQPLAVGQEKELHPMLLIGSIIVGGHALGIVGMIVAVPTITIIQRVARLVYERRRYNGQSVSPQSDSGVQIPPFVC
jgi:predicted PurR-regulated permease PerM